MLLQNKFIFSLLYFSGTFFFLVFLTFLSRGTINSFRKRVSVLHRVSHRANSSGYWIAERMNDSEERSPSDAELTSGNRWHKSDYLYILVNKWKCLTHARPESPANTIYMAKSGSGLLSLGSQLPHIDCVREEWLCVLPHHANPEHLINASLNRDRTGTSINLCCQAKCPYVKSVLCS